MSTNKKHHVLIVGGGFGGVKAAQKLLEDKRFEVTLLTPDDELRYYPTLYRTATGGPRSNSSIPYQVLFVGKKINLIRDSAATIDRKAKTITTDSGETHPFDTLILGLGVVTNYFGIPGMEDFSYSIKSQKEAARFKMHLHQQLIDDNKTDLNYIIVGAGPTGIELAGALPEYLDKLIENHGITNKKYNIALVEAAPKLLPRLPKETSKQVAKQLKKLGVSVYTNSAVQGETIDNLTVNGNPIPSHTVVWTAGVMNHPFFAKNNFPVMNRGKVAVDVYLRAEENIYVIGDNANTPYSGLAQTALVDGEFVANNLIRAIDQKDFKPYKPKKPITIIPAGPNWAAVIWGKLKFYGYAGWLLREASEFVGFSEIEPWNKAAKQWLSELGEQDDCPVCAMYRNS